MSAQPGRGHRVVLGASPQVPTRNGQSGGPGDPFQAAISTAAAIAAATSSSVAAADPTRTKPHVAPAALKPSPPLHYYAPGPLPPPQQQLSTKPPMIQPLVNSYAPAPTTNQFPVVFDQMKLRRGKWTPEEEAYADLLIEEFERGAVEGCENGCTLRSFLSKKLHCAPMRISKKYAGKSIGKHVFLSRSNMSGINGFKDGVTIDNRARLKDLEMKFYKSLCQESDGVSSLAFPGQPTFPPYITHPGPSIAIQATMPMPYITHPAVTQAHNATSHTTTHIPSVATGQWSMTAPVASPAIQLGSQPHEMHTSQLQKTYLSALNQSHPTQTISATPSQPVVPTHSPLPAPLKHPAINNTQIVQSTPAPAPMPLLPMPTLGTLIVPPPVPVPAPAPMPTLPRNQERVGNVVGNATVNQLPPHPNNLPIQTQPPAPIQHKPTISSPHSDIPDFLSGFEKVAAVSQGPKQGTQASVHNANTDAGHIQPSTLTTDPQYSPPFTSRSFDDFHRFLGKGLSPHPLDLNGKSMTVSPTNNSGSGLTPEGEEEVKPVAVTADSYALFAQESVLAVSHHSAYCRTEGTKQNVSNGSTPVPPSFLDSAPTIEQATSQVMPSVVNAANLRAHAIAAEQRALSENAVHSLSSVPLGEQQVNLVSGSEKEESESALGSSRCSVSDNGSDNSSNESDLSSVEPAPKKRKVVIEELGLSEPEREASPVSEAA